MIDLKSTRELKSLNEAVKSIIMKEDDHPSTAKNIEKIANRHGYNKTFDGGPGGQKIYEKGDHMIVHDGNDAVYTYNSNEDPDTGHFDFFHVTDKDDPFHDKTIEPHEALDKHLKSIKRGGKIAKIPVNPT